MTTQYSTSTSIFQWVFLFSSQGSKLSRKIEKNLRPFIFHFLLKYIRCIFTVDSHFNQKPYMMKVNKLNCQILLQISSLLLSFFFFFFVFTKKVPYKHKIKLQSSGMQLLDVLMMKYNVRSQPFFHRSNDVVWRNIHHSSFSPRCTSRYQHTSSLLHAAHWASLFSKTYLNMI